jgi:hypothetical protein
MTVMTGGVHLSVRGRERRVPVRELARWAAAGFLLWAETAPQGPKRFYSVFLLFLFWKSDLSFENALSFRFE